MMMFAAGSTEELTRSSRVATVSPRTLRAARRGVSRS